MLIEELIKQLDNGSLEKALDPYTSDSVFLQRISTFETGYDLKWYEFMQAFDEHKLKPQDDCERLDFAEWRILCQKFEDKLEDGLEGLTIMASPPTAECENEYSQGPSNRAFYFCYTYGSYGVSTNSRAQAETSGRRAYLF